LISGKQSAAAAKLIAELDFVIRAAEHVGKLGTREKHLFEDSPAEDSPDNPRARGEIRNSISDRIVCFSAGIV
jgi:hypothetical protein